MPSNCALFICKEDDQSRYFAEQVALRDDCRVSFISLPKDAIIFAKKNRPEVIVADLDILDANGSMLLRELKDIDKDALVIGLTDNGDLGYRRDLGMYDRVTKPVDIDRLILIIRKGFDQRKAIVGYQKINHGLQERNSALEKQNVLLVSRIEDSAKNLTRLYENLRSTYLHTIKVLAQAIDARDHYTHSHSENVVKYASAIAREMGMSAKDIETISDACQLHDLGKIGVEDHILGKVTPLTPEEWIQIRRHPVTGAQILQPLTFLSDVVEMVRQHHEHYNGSGYPDGRMGEDILLGARIIHLADAYEAMRSARSYRKIPLTKEAAIQEIKKHSGTQFDPKVVETFLIIIDQLDFQVSVELP
jgi:putative nucleotidyltransferase with HDIG domain